MPPSQETIGQRIRRLRLEAGLSQREASGPGVSYAYLSRNYLSGGAQVALGAVAAAAHLI